MGNSCCSHGNSPKKQSSNGLELVNTDLEGTYSHALDTLCLLSWNIDGLDQKFTTERALAVSRIITLRKPEVVYLQEVVNSTWKALTDQLGATYHFYRDDVSFHYYHVLMVRKDSTVVPNGEMEVVRFPKSQQGRHLLQLPVMFHGLEILLLTSHLESLNHFATERKSQLKTTFSIMRNMQDEKKFAIFGGDLNLLDKEVYGIPENIVDVWEACGSDYKERCTWESSDPRLRLDRIFFSSPFDNVNLSPSKFRLVGSCPLSEFGVHASDHLGMWAEFTLQRSYQPPRIKVYSH